MNEELEDFILHAERTAMCPDCGGTGGDPYTNSWCRTCYGTGEVER